MSSPSSPVIVRPRYTYGRRRATSDHDSSFDAANASIDSREDPDFSHSTSLDFDHPPTSDPPDASNASPTSEHDSDREDPNVGKSSYTYNWMAELKAIDKNYTTDGGGSSERPHGHSLGAETRPTTPSDHDYSAGDVFGGSLSSLTNSSQPARPVALSDQYFDSQALPVSGNDSDPNEHPSSPQTSPSNLLGTPRSHSSPTPPTSIDMPPKRGKGKEKALEPLRYDSDGQTASRSKPTKRRDTKTRKKVEGPDKRAKVKRPTKKDIMETKKATARLTAQQPASIVPAPQTGHYTITKYLEHIVPQPERSRTPPIPSTDPIEQFSSPHPEPAPAPIRRASTSQSKPVEASVHSKLSRDMDSDSDSEDMQDFRQLEQQQRMHDFKVRYVEQAQQRGPSAVNGDSDIEIVDDKQTIARDQAQARRGAIARGEVPSIGAKRQLAAAGPSAQRERTTFAITNDSEVRRTLKMAALPSFNSSKAQKAPVKVSPGNLNAYILQRVAQQATEIRLQKDDEFTRNGGKIKEQPRALKSTAHPLLSLQDVIVKRQSRPEAQEVDSRAVQDSESSDEEWKPDEHQAMNEDGQHSDGETRGPGILREEVDTQADDEDDEENPFNPRLPQRRARTAIESDDDDDDDDTENHPPPEPIRGRKLVRDSTWVHGSHSPDADASSLTHPNSASSLGDFTDGTRTEDGTDKENDALLSFDRGEDKENTVIAVQSPVARLGRFGSLFAPEIAASPCGSIDRGAADGVRSPLKELPAEDDDPFGFTPGPPLRLIGHGGDGGSLDASPINLGAGSGLEPAFSLSLSPSGKGKGKARARSTSPSPLGEALDLGGGLGGGIGGGGFSQFFTQEGNARGFEQLKASQDKDDLALTVEPGLKAALDVSNTWRKKADEIFEKEQEHIAQQEQVGVQQDAEPEMFVDANGFLTQTRPSLVSPIPLKTPLHYNNGVRFSSPRSVLSSARKPLAPIPSQDPDDDDHTSPLRRLRRGLQPSDIMPQEAPRLNVFDILRSSRPQNTKKAKKLDKSEFIEGEAEESDEEAGYGFGEKKAKDDDEDDDENQDGILEELVDDAEMDEKTLAEEKVVAKVREHQQEDDEALQKIHLDAVQGRHRMGRNRKRGLDLSDSESEDDENAHKARARAKKVKVNSRTIAELERDPNTKAFAHEYSANMGDDGEEFAFLRNGDDQMDIDGDACRESGNADEEEGEEEEERPMAVSAAQLREELLAAAKQGEQARVFNPDDVSWADRDEDDEDEMGHESRVREISAAEAPNPHRPNIASGALRAKSNVIGNTTPAHLVQWARAETSTRTGGIVGRNAGSSVAVTGHGKTKGGNGSFKGPKSASSSATAKAKPVAKQASMLSAVPSFSKRSKFGS